MNVVSKDSGSVRPGGGDQQKHLTWREEMFPLETKTPLQLSDKETARSLLRRTEKPSPRTRREPDQEASRTRSPGVGSPRGSSAGALAMRGALPTGLAEASRKLGVAQGAAVNLGLSSRLTPTSNSGLQLRAGVHGGFRL